MVLEDMATARSPQGENIDPRRILFLNIPEETSAETLTNYVEVVSQEEVCNLLYQPETKTRRCLAIFPDDITDVPKLQRRVGDRPLASNVIGIKRIPVTKAILVHGLSLNPVFSKDLLTLYFDDVRKSGGDGVIGVKLYCDISKATVEFDKTQTVPRVLERKHVLCDTELQVEAFYPEYHDLILQFLMTEKRNAARKTDFDLPRSPLCLTFPAPVIEPAFDGPTKDQSSRHTPVPGESNSDKPPSGRLQGISESLYFFGKIGRFEVTVPDDVIKTGRWRQFSRTPEFKECVSAVERSSECCLEGNVKFTRAGSSPEKNPFSVQTSSDGGRRIKRAVRKSRKSPPPTVSKVWTKPGHKKETEEDRSEMSDQMYLSQLHETETALQTKPTSFVEVHKSEFQIKNENVFTEVKELNKLLSGDLDDRADTEEGILNDSINLSVNSDDFESPMMVTGVQARPSVTPGRLPYLAQSTSNVRPRLRSSLLAALEAEMSISKVVDRAKRSLERLEAQTLRLTFSQETLKRLMDRHDEHVGDNNGIVGELRKTRNINKHLQVVGRVRPSPDRLEIQRRALRFSQETLVQTLMDRHEELVNDKREMKEELRETRNFNKHLQEKLAQANRQIAASGRLGPRHLIKHSDFYCIASYNYSPVDFYEEGLNKEDGNDSCLMDWEYFEDEETTNQPFKQMREMNERPPGSRTSVEGKSTVSYQPNIRSPGPQQELVRSNLRGQSLQQGYRQPPPAPKMPGPGFFSSLETNSAMYPSTNGVQLTLAANTTGLFGSPATASPTKIPGRREYEPNVDFKPLIPLPDLVEVKTGEEEEEKMFAERCKLYRFDNYLKQWKERGVGELKILRHQQSKKVRIIMRRDQVLKLCANHYLHSNMKLSKMAFSDKSWCWNAVDFADEEVKNEHLAVWFKNRDLGTLFKTVFGHCVAWLLTQSKKEVTSTEDLTQPIAEAAATKQQQLSSEAEAKSDLKPLAEMFKPAEGWWECGGCLLSNGKDVKKCPACATLQPGVNPEDVQDEQSATTAFGATAGATGFKFGSAGGFSFGSSGFSFGTPSESTETASKPATTEGAGGFTFGKPEKDEDLKADAQGGFTFGKKNSQETSTQESKTSSGSSSGFMFGASKDAPQPTDKESTDGTQPSKESIKPLSEMFSQETMMKTLMDRHEELVSNNKEIMEELRETRSINKQLQEQLAQANQNRMIGGPPYIPGALGQAMPAGSPYMMGSPLPAGGFPYSQQPNWMPQYGYQIPGQSPAAGIRLAASARLGPRHPINQGYFYSGASYSFANVDLDEKGLNHEDGDDPYHIDGEYYVDEGTANQPYYMPGMNEWPYGSRTGVEGKSTISYQPNMRPPGPQPGLAGTSLRGQPLQYGYRQPSPAHPMPGPGVFSSPQTHASVYPSTTPAQPTLAGALAANTSGLFGSPATASPTGITYIAPSGTGKQVTSTTAVAKAQASATASVTGQTAQSPVAATRQPSNTASVQRPVQSAASNLTQSYSLLFDGKATITANAKPPVLCTAKIFHLMSSNRPMIAIQASTENKETIMNHEFTADVRLQPQTFVPDTFVWTKTGSTDKFFLKFSDSSEASRFGLVVERVKQLLQSIALAKEVAGPVTSAATGPGSNTAASVQRPEQSAASNLTESSSLLFDGKANITANAKPPVLCRAILVQLVRQNRPVIAMQAVTENKETVMNHEFTANVQVQPQMFVSDTFVWTKTGSTDKFVLKFSDSNETTRFTHAVERIKHYLQSIAAVKENTAAFVTSANGQASVSQPTSQPSAAPPQKSVGSAAGMLSQLAAKHKDDTSQASPAAAPSQTSSDPTKTEASNNVFGGFTFKSTPVISTSEASPERQKAVPAKAVLSPAKPAAAKPFEGFSFSHMGSPAQSSPSGATFGLSPKPSVQPAVPGSPGAARSPSSIGPVRGGKISQASPGRRDDDHVDEYEPNVDFQPVIPLPDLVEEKTGEEEEEKMFAERCKLYRFDNDLKQWKERGVGELVRPPGPQPGLAGTSLRGQSLQYGYRQPSPAHLMPGPGFFSSPQSYASVYPSTTPSQPTLAGALAANTSGLFGSTATASPTGSTYIAPSVPPNTTALQSGTGKQVTSTTAVAKTQASATASVTGQTAQSPVAVTGQPSNTASVQRPVQSAASNLIQSFSLLFDGKATITTNAKPPVLCTAKIFHLMSSNRPMIAIQASTENKETIMNHEFTADVQLQPQTFVPDTFVWTKTGSTDNFFLKFSDSSEASRFGLVVERVKQLLQSIAVAKEVAGPVTSAATGPGSNTAASVQRPEQSAASNLTESSSLLFDGKANITANAKPPVLCRAILVQLVRQNRPVIAMQAVTENKETVMNHEFTADVQVQPQIFVSDTFVWTKTGSTDKFVLKFSDSNETTRFTHAVERIKHYLQSIAAAKENTAASVTSANGQASVSQPTSQPSAAPPQKSVGSAAGMLSQLAAKHKDDTSQASPAAAPSQTSSDPTKTEASKNVFGGFTFKSTPVISTSEASPERQKAVPAKAVLSPAKPAAAKPFEGFSFSHMGSPAQSSPSGAAFGLSPKPSVHPAVPGSPGAARSPSSNGPVKGGRISQASPGQRDDDHVDEYEPNVDFQPVIPLPDLVEEKTGEEEEEKMFAERCKLYRFDNDLKQWKERGVGELVRPPGPQPGLAGTSLRGQSLQYGYRQPSPAHLMPGPGFFSSPQTYASVYPSTTPSQPTLAGALAANTSGLFGSTATASPTGSTYIAPSVPPNTTALQSGTGKQVTSTTAVAKTQASATASVTGQTAQSPVAVTGQPSNTASVQRPVQSAASNLTQSFSLLFDGKATITANAKPPVLCTAKIFHLMSSNRPMIAIQASTENKETIMNHEFTADVQLQPQTFVPDTFVWTKTGSTDKFFLKFSDSSEASRFGLVVERVKQLLQSIGVAKEVAGPVTSAATGPGSNTAASVQRPEQSAASNLTESSSLLFDGKANITANAKPPVLCRAILVQLVRQNRPVIAMQAVTENKETVMNHEFTADVQVQPQMFVSDTFVWTKTGSTDKFVLKFSDSNETTRFTHAVERIKHYLQSIAAAKENTAASVTSANGQASVSQPTSQPSAAPPQKSAGSAAGMLSQLAAKHKDDTSQASPAAAPSQTSSDPTKTEASKNVFGGFTFKSTPVISTSEASPERQKAVPAKAVLSPAKPAAAKPFEGFSFSHMGSPAQSSPSGAAFGLSPKPSVHPAVPGSPGAARSPSSIGPVRGGRISQASPGRRDDDHVDEYEPNVDFQPVIPLPDLVEEKTGEEEEEKMFAERCKLYHFDNDLKQWKERGVGELKILRHQQSKKVRIIMRRDQVLKLCANHNLHCDMKLSKMASSDKSWCWNAVDFADEEVKNEQLAVRFKNKDLAAIFKAVFEDCVAWLSTRSEKEVASTEDLTQPIGEPAATKQQQPSSEAEAKSDLKPLAEMFKPAEGSWECGGCLLRNGKDAKKCPACATLQPGVNPEDVQDEQSATTAFGATAGATGFKFGSAGGFSFGSSGFSVGTPSESTGTASKPATAEGAGGFTFGKPKKGEDLKTNAPAGFTFGKKTSQETSTQESKTSSGSSSGFMFGIPKDAPQPTGKESTDGTEPSKESLKPLSEMFKRPEGAWECGTCMIVNRCEVLKCVACGTLKPGVKAEELKEVSSSSATSLSNVESSGFSFTPSSSNSASSGFTFGASKSNSSSGFSFGTQSTGGNKPSGFSVGIGKPGESGSKTEQGSSLKDLLQSTSSTTDSPFTSMLAKTETPKSSKASAESAVSTPEAEPKSLFGTATKSASDSFVFGSPLTKFTFTPSTPVSSVKPSAITSPKSPEVDPHGHYVNKEGEDSHIFFEPVIKLPDKVELKTGEEDETVVFEHRAKLYRFDNNEWKERGLGVIKLLEHKQNHGLRVLMRREHILKICCNHRVTSDIKLKAMPKAEGKAWIWQAMDFADEEYKHERLAIRFKTPEIAAQFKEKFDKGREVAEKLSPSKSHGDTSTTKDATPSGNVAALQNLFGDSKSSKPEGDDDDVIFVDELKASPDQVAMARKFKLPDNFYLYESYPPCPGCLGCVDGDRDKFAELLEKSPTAAHKNSPRKAESEKPDAVPLFGSVPVKQTESAPLPETEGVSLFGNVADTLSFAALAQNSDQAFVSKSDPNTPFSWSGAGSQLFGGGNAGKVGGPQGDEDEVAPSNDIHFEPIVSLPEIAVKTGEEDDEVLFCQRSKLYRFDKDSKQWKERGTGDFKILKNKVTGVFRMLQRRQQVLKISCIHLLTSDLQLRPMSTSETSWCWTAMDYSDDEPEVQQFAIKFKNVALAQEFKEKFESCQEEMWQQEAVTGEAPDSPFTSMLAKTETPKSSKASAESAVSKPEAEPKSLFFTATKSASDSFVFGSPLTKFTFTPSTPVSSVKPSAITSPKSPEVDPHGHYVNKEGEDSHIFFEPVIKLPDKVELKTGEEDENVVFEHRAKLYRFDNNEWKERGLGVIKLLEHKQNHGLRVLMRREHILKICCNHRVTSDMELKAMPKAEGKAWIWQAMDFADEEYKHERLAIRFKTPEIAAQFKEKFDKGREVAEELSPSKSHGDTSTTKDSTPSGNVAALRNLFGDSKSSKPEGDDDDVIFVDELKASPDQVAMARKFKLPDNFYLYESSPPCPGCLGCVDGDRDKFAELLEKSPTAAHKNSPRKAESEKPDAVPLFGSVPVKQTESAPLRETEGVSLFGNVAGTVSFAALAQNSDQAFVSKSEPTTPFSWSGAGSLLFGGGNAAPIVSLPEISVKTGEEGDEVLFCQRSKLYRFDKDIKQWKERGTGEFKILKNKVTGVFRMLQRRQQVLKISCNHLLTSDLQLRPMSTSETSWCWTAMDFSDDEPEVQQFAIKFKNVALAQEFKEKFESCQEEMRQQEAVTAEVREEIVEPFLQSSVDSITGDRGNVYYKQQLDQSAVVREEIVEPRLMSSIDSTTGDRGNVYYTQQLDQSEAVQPSDSGEVEKGDDSVTQEETDEDEEDDDNDEYEDVEDDDDDDDAPETLFEKRVTLSCIQDGKWKMLGISDLKVQHDDDVGAYRILMKTDELEKICNHVICKETIVTSDQKRHCEWAAVDFSTNVPTKRQFKATFSSTPALEEFLVVFQQGKELAFESDVSERSGNFPVEIIKPEVVSSPDGKHGAGPPSLGEAVQPSDSGEVEKGDDSVTQEETEDDDDEYEDVEEEEDDEDEEDDDDEYEDVEDDDDDDDAPETLFEKRVTLSCIQDGKWKMLGMGDLKVQHDDDVGAYRILMKTDELEKICNHVICKETIVTSDQKRHCEWTAVDFSTDVPTKHQFKATFSSTPALEEFLVVFPQGKELAFESDVSERSGNFPVEIIKPEVVSSPDGKHGAGPPSLGEAVQPSDSGEVEKGDDSVNQEETEEDDDDEYEDVEDDDDDDDAPETLFEKRVTLSCIQDGKWKMLGMGDLKVQHDDDVGAYRILMKTDELEKICNHVICKETIFTSDQKRHCEWTAVDFSTDVPTKRQFKATFSSTPALEEFLVVFQQGKELAFESGVSERSENFPVEIIKPEVVSSPDGKHGAGPPSLGGV